MDPAEQNPKNRNEKQRPSGTAPWRLMFAGLALLGVILAVAFGGKALGFWQEVPFAVGAGAVALAYLLYAVSNAIQRKETGED